MFLRSIELFGFKSFPERTRIEFSEGISAILGPNGCGKSNIVDAVKWVLGEQSHKSLRADAMEDVIFNGTEHRKPLNWCEVILTLSNETGILDLDLPEITVGRRLFRNGESEYTINRTPVKLKDVRDLFMDTGVGKSAYSIMEQGRIDQILSHKPEERRYIFEEAAGITRYRSRSQEAERKLELTEENLRQVEGILGEVKRNYDTLKAQAARTETYRQIRQRIFLTEQAIARQRLQGLLARAARVQGELNGLEAERTRLKEALQTINQEVGEGLAGVERWEEELKGLQRRIHDLELERGRLHTQLSVLQEKEASLEDNLLRTRLELQRVQEQAGTVGQQIVQVRQETETLRQDLDKDAANIHQLQERLQAQQDSIESHNQEEGRLLAQEAEIQEAIRSGTEVLAALTEDLVRVIDRQIATDPELWNSLSEWLTEFETDMGSLLRTIRARQTLFEDRARTPETQKSDWIVEQWREVARLVEGLESKFRRFTRTIPGLLGELFSPQGSLWQKRSQDQNLRELHDRLDQQRRQREEVVRNRREAQELVQQLTRTLEDLKINQARRESFVRTREEDIRRLESQSAQLHQTEDELRKRLAQGEQRRLEFQERRAQIAREQQDLQVREESLRNQQEEVRQKILGQNHALADKEKQQKALFQELHALQQRIERLSQELGEVHADIRALKENFSEKHGLALEPGEAVSEEEVADLRDTLNRLKEEQKALGQVNLMAPEEFREVAQRYEFLVQQIDDLKKAREDLSLVVAEIQKEASKLFLESFQRIQKNFHEVFRRLFGGGRAELRLTDEQRVLEAGVELYCQPPGKKLESLSLLSGGEKSLTAVALLFAVYMVRPSPFCILDEIDAALDESNVGRFIDMLREFSNTSQFVVITHNKRTVTGASTLIGITMEESGVSKVLTIRLGGQPSQEAV